MKKLRLIYYFCLALFLINHFISYYFASYYYWIYYPFSAVFFVIVVYVIFLLFSCKDIGAKSRILGSFLVLPFVIYIALNTKSILSSILRPCSKIKNNSGFIVYSDKYNLTLYGIEKLHPFDSCKYEKIKNALVESGIVMEKDFVEPCPPTKEQLLRIHSEKYLNSLTPPVVARIFELGAC